VTKFDRTLQRWRIEKAAGFIKPRDTVLDIGCADGSLFQQVPGLGPSIGVDPDLDPAGIAPMNNVRFFRGLFPQALPEPMKFDAITMLAVLEHVPPDQQRPLAQACADHLKPGGRLIITVPSPAVDLVLAVLRFFHIIHGMSLEQHYGFDVKQVPSIFSPCGLRLEANRTFQFGLNNLFVFQREPVF
jgi:2-polyprenyl-3-methyl-5-hydroxy-6-metoxy-1,4-benzoquinol methylase